MLYIRPSKQGIKTANLRSGRPCLAQRPARQIRLVERKLHLRVAKQNSRIVWRQAPRLRERCIRGFEVPGRRFRQSQFVMRPGIRWRQTNRLTHVLGGLGEIPLLKRRLCGLFQFPEASLRRSRAFG